ncbi:cobyric acid synthase [Metabacillus fastidiosus]|uniref:cobyric acid synthase n=1 Tax=Metabacillus fastidiosus TaxID=1458 RepID=UPI002E1F0B68|nr:cobyric acid synthase [Metabacillus fastidiosus]MED4454692.1 cobyric acid synthase [Metabacillus fastidiosus]
MSKALPIMFQGTHSDAGKSVIVTAFCRIFANEGYNTTPFKSQNMALNSYITLDGKEIGRAQGVQAEAAKTAATTNMNPILIKPNRDHQAQIVVHGVPYKNMEAYAYRREFFETGLQLINESLHTLGEQYDRVVIEGAGSPAEVNLNDRELVNMRVAHMANAPVVLIGDIEKGGVFASLVGTLQLLEQKDRDRIIGVIINKFRGDKKLLESGLTWFEEYTGKPVLGVIPYLSNLQIDAEDSVMLDRYDTKKTGEKDIDIAVIRYPRISNFTDIDPFLAEEDCHIRFVTNRKQLEDPDLIILPGSKNTIDDLLFLKETGLFDEILKLHKEKKVMIFGICGGYQMLGELISDPLGMESATKSIDGFALLPANTTMTANKTTVRSQGELIYDGKKISIDGYEIHMGETVFTGQYDSLIKVDDHFDGCKNNDQTVVGTYFHGIFHNDEFRTVLLNLIRADKGLSPIQDRPLFNDLREREFDRLADHVKEHVDIDFIEGKMREFGRREMNE